MRDSREQKIELEVFVRCAVEFEKKVIGGQCVSIFLLPPFPYNVFELNNINLFFYDRL